jgi:hypothetical protein
MRVRLLPAFAEEREDGLGSAVFRSLPKLGWGLIQIH